MGRYCAIRVDGASGYEYHVVDRYTGDVQAKTEDPERVFQLLEITEDNRNLLIRRIREYRFQDAVQSVRDEEFDTLDRMIRDGDNLDGMTFDQLQEECIALGL